MPPLDVHRIETGGVGWLLRRKEVLPVTNVYGQRCVAFVFPTVARLHSQPQLFIREQHVFTYVCVLLCTISNLSTDSIALKIRGRYCAPGFNAGRAWPAPCSEPCVRSFVAPICGYPGQVKCAKPNELYFNDQFHQ